MLTVMFRNKGVENFVEVPEKAVVTVDQVTVGLLEIKFCDPFSSEAYNYYSDEVVFIMNSKGSTISTTRISKN